MRPALALLAIVAGCRGAPAHEPVSGAAPAPTSPARCAIPLVETDEGPTARLVHDLLDRRPLYAATVRVHRDPETSALWLELSGELRADDGQALLAAARATIERETGVAPSGSDALIARWHEAGVARRLLVTWAPSRLAASLACQLAEPRSVTFTAVVSAHAALDLGRMPSFVLERLRDASVVSVETFRGFGMMGYTVIVDEGVAWSAAFVAAVAATGLRRHDEDGTIYFVDPSVDDTVDFGAPTPDERGLEIAISPGARAGWTEIGVYPPRDR